MTPETKEIATLEGEKFTNVQRLGRLLAASGYFTDVKDMAQAAVKVMAGEELGIPPIASMMGIYVVKGKIQLGSNLIASRIRYHGYDYRIAHLDNQKCVIQFLSRQDADGKRIVMGESSFSIADAQQAGIAGETYKKYPRNMLFSRAISNGAKWFTPDVFGGIPIYSEGELSEVVEDAPEPTAAIEHIAYPAPAPAPAPAPTPVSATSTFAEKLAVYTREKERVGEKAYYDVLGAHGFLHANEVVKRPLMERQEVYNDLKALPDLADSAQEPEEL